MLNPVKNINVLLLKEVTLDEKVSSDGISNIVTLNILTLVVISIWKKK